MDVAASGDLAAIQACYVQLRDLVPTVPLDAELSRLQLLQHVIDYIGDLELALHLHSQQRQQRQQQQQQQQDTSKCLRRSPSDDHSCNKRL